MNEPTYHVPTIPEIRAWVESLAPDDIAGTIEDCNACLVARAAEHLNPNLVFCVFPGPAHALQDHERCIALFDGYWDIVPGTEQRLSDELCDLAMRFDKMSWGTSDETWGGWGDDVSAAQVLAHWNDLVGAP